MANFIDLDQIDILDLEYIVNLGLDLKSKKVSLNLADKNLAMIFEKSSTRTRVSFEVAINQLKGHAIVMNQRDMQLGKGETIADTAKVLSRYVDAVMIRSNSHKTITEFAQNSSIPVINALSDFSHPCQIIASLMAIKERIGDLKNKKISWFGDANNVLNSYIHACKAFGYDLRIAIPDSYDFCDEEIIKAKKNGASITKFSDAKEAAMNSDVIITDTWFSMGDVAEKDDALRQRKIKDLQPFQVNKILFDVASKNALFTHCLPAYRGFEVTEDVIDSERSIIFDEAENRLHAQKAILLWCFGVK